MEGVNGAFVYIEQKAAEPHAVLLRTEDKMRTEDVQHPFNDTIKIITQFTMQFLS